MAIWDVTLFDGTWPAESMIFIVFIDNSDPALACFWYQQSDNNY